MIINCALCNHQFKSLIIEPPKACQDLSRQISQHFNVRHKRELQKIVFDLQRIGAIALTYMLASRHLDIPEPVMVGGDGDENENGEPKPKDKESERQLYVINDLIRVEEEVLGLLGIDLDEDEEEKIDGENTVTEETLS